MPLFTRRTFFIQNLGTAGGFLANFLMRKEFLTNPKLYLNKNWAVKIWVKK